MLGACEYGTLARHPKLPGSIPGLDPRPRSNERRYANLFRNGVLRTYCVSVLMAKAYGIPNPRRCEYVVHRNHDNTDFRRANLAWATLAELRWEAFFRVEDRRHHL